MSTVEIVLDTIPPVLTIDLVDRVQPPDRLNVVVTPSEPLIEVWAELVDSLGGRHHVGTYKAPGTTSYSLSVPTVGLPTGSCRLAVQARDLAGNLTGVSRLVVIDRPRAFDVNLSVLPVFDLQVSRDKVWDATVAIHPEWDVDVEIGAHP